MRYRSAAFALKSAHALASPGSTHFPARGVDADALLSPAAVLYLLRFSGDVVTAEQTFVTGVVTPDGHSNSPNKYLELVSIKYCTGRVRAF